MTFTAQRYPKEWKAIRASIVERAGDTCECTGQCGSDHRGRCDAPNGELIVRDSRDAAVYRVHHCGALCMAEDCGSTKVVLTVAHVDHDEQNNDPKNLLALCQRCHLKLDAADNLARRRERRTAEDGQNPLPLFAAMPEHRKVARDVG